MKPKKKVVKRTNIVFYEEDSELYQDLSAEITVENSDFQKVTKALLREALFFRKSKYRIIANEIFRKD